MNPTGYWFRKNKTEKKKLFLFLFSFPASCSSFPQSSTIYDDNVFLLDQNTREKTYNCIDFILYIFIFRTYTTQFVEYIVYLKAKSGVTFMVVDKNNCLRCDR